jgi:dolichol-phosphate mannosyltransferase
MFVTIIIPCFNEKNTICELVEKVLKQKIKKQIILIDDCSNDGTQYLIKKKLMNKVSHVIFNKKNIGKGGCIQAAKKFVKGDIIIIQDADLEYDPYDYKKLLDPFKKKKANVVYGSRVLKKKNYKNLNFNQRIRVFANYILTVLSNFLNNQNLTDAHTGYKVFKKNIFFRLKLRERDFRFCPEVNTKLSKIRENILEVPISYNGRSYDEGKKIKFADGFKAIYSLFKHSFFKN